MMALIGQKSRKLFLRQLYSVERVNYDLYTRSVIHQHHRFIGVVDHWIKGTSGSGQISDRTVTGTRTMKLTLSSYRQITHGLTRSAEKKRRMKAKKARIGIIVLLNLVPRVPVPIKNRNNN
ncbi:hypothetical protein YC2023_020111 [Brassica napus]